MNELEVAITRKSLPKMFELLCRADAGFRGRDSLWIPLFCIARTNDRLNREIVRSMQIGTYFGLDLLSNETYRLTPEATKTFTGSHSVWKTLQSAIERLIMEDKHPPRNSVWDDIANDVKKESMRQSEMLSTRGMDIGRYYEQNIYGIKGPQVKDMSDFLLRYPYKMEESFIDEMLKPAPPKSKIDPDRLKPEFFNVSLIQLKQND